MHRERPRPLQFTKLLPLLLDMILPQSYGADMLQRSRQGPHSVAHLCPTLCDSMDCSPPGSSVHGILQARIPVWVAMPFSRGS